jgi:hypothetical protein
MRKKIDYHALLNSSSHRGVPRRSLSQLLLRSGWHAPDGRPPYAPDPPLPQDLSTREAWRMLVVFGGARVEIAQQ